jgi:hypothetical protein
MSANEKPNAEKATPIPHIQGEGDYEAARQYRNETEHFLEGADVPDLARKAAPKSKKEAQELEQAEQVGLAHRADKQL